MSDFTYRGLWLSTDIQESPDRYANDGVPPGSRAMTKRTYVCNFCRMESSDGEDIIGLRWEHPNILIVEPAIKSENHLCLACTRAIRSLSLGESEQ